MTRFRGVLVLPLDKQNDRDDHLIDPAGITFDPDQEFPISPDFDHNVKPLGRGKLSRADDGSIMVEGELDLPVKAFYDDTFKLFKLAVGVRVTISEFKDKNVVTKSDFMGMALTAEHKDPDQPPIEILDKRESDHA